MDDYKKISEDLMKALIQQKSVRESEIKDFNTPTERSLLLEDAVEDLETACLLLSQYGFKEFEHKYDTILYSETEGDPMSFTNGIKDAYFDTLVLHDDFYETIDDVPMPDYEDDDVENQEYE